MRNIRLAVVLGFVAPLLGYAAPADARSTTQAQLHDAFVRMDAQWPNVSSHDYWLALRDAEDLARRLTTDERTSDPTVARDLRVFEVYRRCWMALHAKEKALSEFLVGQLILQDTPENADAAREHFALALASWDEAFRDWPFMVRENIRGDVLGRNGEVQKGGLITNGRAWRALAQRAVDSLAPQ